MLVSNNESHLKVIFAAAVTEDPGAAGLTNFIGYGDLPLSPPELTMEDTEGVQLGSQISANDTGLLQLQQVPSRTGWKVN